MDQSAYTHKPLLSPGESSSSSPPALSPSVPDSFMTSSHKQSIADTSPGNGNRLRCLLHRLSETSMTVRETNRELFRARVNLNAQSVLIITKARDNHLVRLTRQMALWLMDCKVEGRQRGLIVYVDEQLRHSKRFDLESIRRNRPDLFVSMRQSQPMQHESLDSDEGQLRFWTASMCRHHSALFDLVITLGGDGTVLFASWLFQKSVPPVIPFSLGSLGFLTPFRFENYPSIVESAVTKGLRLCMRMRFRATVYRAMDSMHSYVDSKRRKAFESDNADKIMKNIKECGWCCVEMEPGAENMEVPVECDDLVHTYRSKPVESFEFLNDLVVDRGPSPFVTMLEVFADDMHLTTAHADGLCIATPTGSTAYSLSAGGSLVHPFIPAMLITPICPHTLSFRPMLVPDSLELRIAVPHNSRSNAWASFDGRGRVEIARGDHIKITASPYPFLTALPDDEFGSWFESVSRTLNWNQRKHQMGFKVVDKYSTSKVGGQPPQRRRSSTHPVDRDDESALSDMQAGEAENNVKNGDHVGHEDEDDDEVFDIDDPMPSQTTSSLHKPWGSTL